MTKKRPRSSKGTVRLVPKDPTTRAKRAALKAALGALQVFPTAYPEREWEQRLHEEGCCGTHLLPEERNEDECWCDGDDLAEQIKKAISMIEEALS